MNHFFTPLFICLHRWDTLPTDALALKALEFKKRRTITDPQLLIDEAELAAQAMRQLSEAMERAEPLMAQVQREHFTHFTQQMRALFEVEVVQIEEPYLEGLLAEGALNYTQRLERHLLPLEQFIETTLAHAEALITGEAVSVTVTTKTQTPPLSRTVFIPESLKKLDFSRLLAPQIEATIDTEAGLTARWLNAQLEEKRQKQMGVSQYIWGTAGDNRVRPSHAANEGNVFSWNNAPGTGHPGAVPNCRCFAIPAGTLSPPDDEGAADAEGVEVAGLGKIALAAAIAKIAQAAAKTKQAQQALKRVKDVFKKTPKTTKPLKIEKATFHGIKRGVKRSISEKDIDKAIKSAERKGKVEVKTGKYGTKQKHYTGDNGVVVIIETEGRNAGKIITT